MKQPLPLLEDFDTLPKALPMKKKNITVKQSLESSQLSEDISDDPEILPKSPLTQRGTVSLTENNPVRKRYIAIDNRNGKEEVITDFEKVTVHSTLVFHSIYAGTKFLGYILDRNPCFLFTLQLQTTDIIKF